MKEPPPDVAAVYADFPAAPRRALLALREVILRTAAALPEVGELTETLKWGEPSYLPKANRVGTTVRIAWKEKTPDQVAMFVHCQTNLIDTFRTRFPELRYEGNRAVVFDVVGPLPEEVVAECVEMALTYHLAKRRRAS